MAAPTAAAATASFRCFRSCGSLASQPLEISLRAGTFAAWANLPPSVPAFKARCQRRCSTHASTTRLHTEPVVASAQHDRGMLRRRGEREWLASAHLSAPLTMQRPSTGIAHWF